MKNNILLKIILTTFTPLVLSSGCGGITASNPSSSIGNEIIPEIDFCSTSTNYSNGVIVSGTAVFKKRGLVITKNLANTLVTDITLGSVISNNLPIKYAEVRILQNTNVIQCGTTNNLGELKALDGVSNLVIPAQAGSYSIQVMARSNYNFNFPLRPVQNVKFSVSVLEDIYSNTVYSVSSNINSMGSAVTSSTSVSLIAQAQESLSSKIEGGAFNIYNDWATTFEYLTDPNNTGTQDISCLNHDTNPMNNLKIYWKAGFNPYQYAFPNENPSTLPQVSFYLRSDKELYINGGRLGNVTSADTDHFDDAVILHEIGHHVENVCGTMDSPGGTHFAQFRIDPRLAWSEGWGNYFGAHIIQNNKAKINPVLDINNTLPNNEWLHYNDTAGYLDNSVTTAASLILMRLNKDGDGSQFPFNDETYDPVSSALFPGESHFREGSISRALFKASNDCQTNCVNSPNGVSFDKFWMALGRSMNGMGNVNTPFRSSAHFFEKVFEANSNSFSSAMSTMLTTDEALHLINNSVYTTSATSISSGSVTVNRWPGYGIKLTTNTNCSRTILEPKRTTYTYSDESDQRYSNHFYTFRKSDLPGVSAIRIIPDSSNCPVDLDLIVFNDGYLFNEDCTSYNSQEECTSFQKSSSSDSIVASARTPASLENLSISNLPSNYFLLNVRGYSSNPNSINESSQCVYTLTDQNGVRLCPSTSY